MQTVDAFLARLVRPPDLIGGRLLPALLRCLDELPARSNRNRNKLATVGSRPLGQVLPLGASRDPLGIEAIQGGVVDDLRRAAAAIIATCDLTAPIRAGRFLAGRALEPDAHRTRYPSNRAQAQARDET